MATVGVFFHRSFKGKPWPIIGDKFRAFPEALNPLFKEGKAVLIEPKPAPEKLLLKVHTKEYLRDVKSRWYYQGALLSVGGCIEAAEKVWKGELTSALVFSVAAGHHAGRSYAWGGTYLSCFGPAVEHLLKLGASKIAVLDTDSHHGDGDREVFSGNSSILHVCFCSYDRVEEGGLKVDVNVGWRTTDDEYLRKVELEFIKRAYAFEPDFIFHFLGHDTCQGDYGDRGLTPDFYPRLVAAVKACADELCRGRYVIVTGGGSRVDVAEYVFTTAVKTLIKPRKTSRFKKPKPQVEELD
ncbi:MAG: histone deacetylase [Thermoprotei archaeon]|nr:MAG: histone deacetylase [Thermoprotei archaeon]